MAQRRACPHVPQKRETGSWRAARQRFAPAHVQEEPVRRGVRRHRAQIPKRHVLACSRLASLDKLTQERKAEDVFLDLLGRFTRENRFVSVKSSSNYAPALFAREDEAKRHALSKKVLEAAMRRLFQAKKIRNEPYGKPSRNSFHIVRTV